MSLSGWLGCGLVTTIMNFFTDITMGLIGNFGGGEGIAGYIIPGMLLLFLFAYSKKHALLFGVIFVTAIAVCGAPLPI